MIQQQVGYPNYGQYVAAAVPQIAYDEFDTSTAQTLYWKQAPVVVTQADREDQRLQLTIRILLGSSKSNHNIKILRVHLGSESSVLLLHTFEVTEDEFQALKIEQGILVDFSHFPTKLISLLDKCIAATGESPPRFQATMRIQGAESVLRIVETNDFKQLAHIALTFRQGTDSTIKQYLAFRLNEVKTERDQLGAQLDSSKVECNNRSQALECARYDLAETRAEADRLRLEMAATVRGLQAEAMEVKANEKAALKEHLDRERQEAESKLLEQLERSQERVSALEQDSRALRQAKFQLDTQVSELGHQVGALEGRNQSLAKEGEDLRSEVAEARQLRQEVERRLSEAQTRLAALEEREGQLRQLGEAQKARIADLEGSCRSWEQRCNELRESSAGHEQRANTSSSELATCRATIEKLTNELKVSKDKTKRKSVILERQEEELRAKEATIAESKRDFAAQEADLNRRGATIEGLDSKVADLQSKLQESQEQLTADKDMITWLNQQLNESQAQLAPQLSSRYTFRPSAPPPATLAAAAQLSQGTTASPSLRHSHPRVYPSLQGPDPVVTSYKRPAYTPYNSSKLSFDHLGSSRDYGAELSSARRARQFTSALFPSSTVPGMETFRSEMGITGSKESAGASRDLGNHEDKENRTANFGGKGVPHERSFSFGVASGGGGLGGEGGVQSQPGSARTRVFVPSVPLPSSGPLVAGGETI